MAWTSRNVEKGNDPRQKTHAPRQRHARGLLARRVRERQGDFISERADAEGLSVTAHFAPIEEISLKCASSQSEQAG